MNQDELPYKRQLKATRAELARERREIEKTRRERLKDRGINPNRKVKVIKHPKA